MYNIILANEGFYILWMVLAFAAIAGIAFLCYKFIPGLKVDKNDELKDESTIASEEVNRILVPMSDENVEVNKDDEKGSN